MAETCASVVGLGEGAVESPKRESIVISGLSGRFPESSNVEEFAENLFGGIDMITEDGRRWTPGLHGLPTRSGKLKELDKFDADYFSVHAKQADYMDPQLRMLLEVTHEAIIDAGVNPHEIRGKNVGVFIGASGSECEQKWIADPSTKHGYALFGCTRSMFSNRISFAFDFKGPSFTLDTACSSSLMCLEQACAALKLGHCDAAIVGGANLCLEPRVAQQFHRMKMLSANGKCQSFDASGDGYVRSEAVVAIFLQRKDVARRYYASILAVKTNTDGHKAEGVTFPSKDMQKALLEETYKEAGIDPNKVVYVEAHGTGTPAGDPQELNAIAEAFCQDRDSQNPLLIGSVKSNMGHSEPVSGLCGVVKVLLAMQRGIIPGNLHYKSPNLNIPALNTGLLKVVSENMEWKGGITGINSFGFGGANVHAILQSNETPFLKTSKNVHAEIPYIIPFSGRSNDLIASTLQEIISRKIHREQLYLLHEVHSKNIPGNQFRGFAVVTDKEADTKIPVDEIQSQLEPPQVWFIFNGMGSQWAGMGTSLMNFKTSRKSLEKSAVILKTKNLDLLDILTNGNDGTFENVLNSFVSIAAIQIALVDLLSSMEIKPDGIIGHSIGELGAAYADSCLTAEQVILTAHARGQAILELGPGDGAMAAIGLSWEEALQKCPEGIFPACHNSKNSVTVSGPANLIKDFVKALEGEGIFARKVNSSNQAFHSKYIGPAKLKFKGALDKIIPVPAPRSSRWISSSIPESEWNSDLAKTSSVDYHVNNLVSPVLFQEALEKIPESSVVIEIGPHCLLQAILKRSLPNCAHIGLLNKNSKDGSIFLCYSIGNMFNFGLNPSLSALYPKVHLPVPLNTPFLSSVVSKCWDHSNSWNVPPFTTDATHVKRNGQDSFTYEISLDKEEDAFYSGHRIGGRLIFPQSGLIVFLWKSWAEKHQQPFEKTPFVIENLVISRATIIPRKDQAPLKFQIIITDGTGEFKIRENGANVASGTIRFPTTDDTALSYRIPSPDEKTKHIVLNKHDFYKYMRLRGYEYSSLFQGIQNISFDGGWAEVEFSNWVTFLDALLHLLVGSNREEDRSLLLPTTVKRITVDPQKLLEHLTSAVDSVIHKNEFTLAFCKPDMQLICCEGVQIHGQKFQMAVRNHQHSSLQQTETFEFTPFFDNQISDSLLKSTTNLCLQACIGLVLENVPGEDLKVLEITRNPENAVAVFVQKFCDSQPRGNCRAIVTGKDSELGREQKNVEIFEAIERCVVQTPSEFSENLKIQTQSTNLFIASSIDNLKEVFQHAKIGTFFLILQSNTSAVVGAQIPNLELCSIRTISRKISKDSVLYLLRKFHLTPSASANHLSSKQVTIGWPKMSSIELSNSYEWIENLKEEMKQVTNENIAQGFRINVISNTFSSGKFVPSGILGLVNSLRLETGGQALRCFFINDPDSPVLDFQKPTQDFQKIMESDLFMNVYQNGVWGSYRFFPLKPESSKHVEHAYLNFQKRGDLSSFQWFESPLKYSSDDLCSVYYSALNFRDVMLASGKLNPGSLPNNLGSQDCVLGMEFSGVNSKGKRVMGILPAKAMATSVAADPGFLWNVPPNWSLVEAATVPVAYATAYYALIVRGGLQEGESVLIHGGAGAVGLAAISIALSKNCTIFATVGSINKREFLKSTFPQLTDSCFANSRDTSFYLQIMKETNGKGVDVVLNSLAGDKLMASVDCTAQHGRFLELGKVDLFHDTKLGMSILLKNISIGGILLDSLTTENPHQHAIWKLLENGMESGVVKPLNYTIFSDHVDDIEKAFRFMASGKHIGKILIHIRNEDEKLETKTINAIPRTYFDPSKSYIILGGLGGFGLELCDWMIIRGATKLMLISRSGVTTGYQKLCLSRWNKAGAVSVITSTQDATTFEGATEILKKALGHFNGADIGGIFNLAMVLRDGLLENQTPENFEAVAKPKINATIAMDKASRILAPQLEYFVCFSSVASGRGSHGQSNYAFANSAVERICEMRKKEGLCGLAIQWGPIGDVGGFVDRFDVALYRNVSIEGCSFQKIASCLRILDNFLVLSSARENNVTVSSVVLTSKSVTTEEMSESQWLASVARILGIKVEELEKSPHKPLYTFGMDSLMVAELRQVIQINCGPSVDVSGVQNRSVSELLELVQKASKWPKSCKSDKSKMEKLVNLKTHQADLLSLQDLSSKVNDRSQEAPAGEQETLLADSIRANAVTQAAATNFLENLRYVAAYILTVLVLGVIYLILSPLSTVLQLFVKMYIELFQDSSQIKILDGLNEATYATENYTILNILKCVGVPNRDKVIELVDKRLLNFRTNMYFDCDLQCDAGTLKKPEEFYEPFERLQWAIEKGFLFCYWKKCQNFDASRHVIFEEVLKHELDSEMPRLAKHYHNLKWDEYVGSSRPWWEIRIVFSQTAEEFLAVFACSHAYGDGPSFTKMLQFGLADVALPISKPTKKADDFPLDISVSNLSYQIGMLDELNHLLVQTKQAFSKALLLFDVWTKLMLITLNSGTISVTAKPKSNALSVFGKFPLGVLKSVKDPETGKPFHLNAVIISLFARVYERIVGESEAMRNRLKLPFHLTSAVTWAPFQNPRINLVNNALVVPFEIPVAFTNGILNANSTKNMHQKLKMSQFKLKNSGEMQNLKLTKQVLQKISTLPLPIVYVFNRVTLKNSFVYINVPATIPYGATFFNGFKLKDIYGISPPLPLPLALNASTDSFNNTVKLTLSVDQTNLQEVSADFIEKFFPYFEQEVNALQGTPFYK